MPIRLKPVVPLALLAASLAGIGFIDTRQSRVEALSTELHANQATRIADRLDAHIQSARAFLLAKAANPVLQSALSQKSPTELLTELDRESEVFGLSVVSVHERGGNVLYLAGAPSRSSGFYGFESLIAQAYENGKAQVQAGLYRDAPALLFAQPVFVSGQPQGLLLAARSLDQAFLETLAANVVPLRLQVAGQALSTGTGEPHPVPVNLGAGEPLRLELLYPGNGDYGWTWLTGLIGLALALAGLALGWLSLRQEEQRRLSAQASLREALAPTIRRDAALTQLAALEAQDGVADLARAIRGVLEKDAGALREQQQRQVDSAQELNRLQNEINRLRRELDEALRAPRTKSEFLSRMGDEITTPMHSVISMLDLLREYELPGEPKELLSIAHRSAHTLSENLNNILDFSKLDADMLSLHVENFQVQTLVTEVVEQLKPHAADKGLRLESNLAEGVPAVVAGDPGRIRQILSNLVGNAIRFTKDGEVAVYVDILQPADDRFLRFSVVDTGIGIPRDAQQGLFDSLDRHTKLTNSSFAGRLRLIVAKYMAELMGGQIGVSSEPGKGSRFWFTVKLPR